MFLSLTPRGFVVHLTQIDKGPLRTLVHGRDSELK